MSKTMKNYNVTGWNNHGSYQTVYVSAAHSVAAIAIGKDHGLANKITEKASNISGGFTA